MRLVSAAPSEPVRVLFSEEDMMFTWIESVLSAELAVENRTWLELFFGVEGASGLDAAATLRAEYGLDGLAFDCETATDPADFAERIGEAEIVVCERTPLDAEVLARAQRLRFVQKLGTNLRMIDLAAAADRGVMVASWRREGNRRVAEHMIALMLTLAKSVAR